MRGLGAALSILAVLGFSGAAAAEGAGAATRSHGLTARTAAAKFVPGEVVVRFKPGVGRTARAVTLRETETERKQWLRVPGAELLALSSGISVEQGVRKLEARADVLYAEPNYIYRATATLPNDPRFGELWGLNQAGDHDIDAPEAWDLTTGGSVRVAVVDTGVAYDHPDLALNMVPGNDFAAGDSDPRDENGHGTHVAGTIGARGNNLTGVTGVNWNVELMPLRVLDAAGSGTNADITNAFAYAAANGAKVVNASLGCSGAPCFAQAMKNAIDAAAGTTLFVVAAGNDGQNNDAGPTYPCNYTSANLVCVAATDQTDTLADFSNYGANAVDLAAPGTGILSAWPAYTNLFTESFETDLTGRWVAGGSPNTWARTSEASGGGAYSASDSPGTDYARGADNWLRTAAPVSFAGRTGCKAAYALALESETDWDFLSVETSPTGTDPWDERDAWHGTTSGAFYDLETDLAELNGDSAVYLRIRLTSDPEAYEFDGAHVDDVALRCLSTSYGPNDYSTIQGTSMATPHAAGVAALVWARNPAATVAGVRAALLTTVDPIAGLAGKVASGGRLNADRAVQAAFNPPPPPPDNIPPTVSAQSTSPSLNNWSNVSATVASWSGADAAGIDGYSFAWSPDAAFVPDEVKDVEENVTSTSSNLLDGRSWFHVRARDGGGNWSDAVHLGPFLVDTFPPARPTLSSPTHRAGVASANRLVETNWITLGDSLSGVDGFSFAWSRQQLVAVDQTKDAEEGVVRTTSPRLDSGAWWFGIRSRDNAGNWSDAATLGPFVVVGAAPVCTVPRLRGLTLLGAKRALVKKGCALGRVTRAYSRRVRRGRVLGQRPRPALRLRRGAKVAVVLSRGRRRSR